jgi:hypothetical protein
MDYLKQVKTERQFITQQHWRANAPVICSSSLPASVLLSGGFDQHPSKPHDVGVAVGVNVRVGVDDGTVGRGVYVCVGLPVGDGVNVFVAVPVFDGVSVMVGVLLDRVGVRVGEVVRVGVEVCDAVGGLNQSVSTMRVYCRCGSLSRARIVTV